MTTLQGFNIFNISSVIITCLCCVYTLPIRKQDTAMTLSIFYLPNNKSKDL